MTTTQCAAICETRLRSWRDILIRQHATPILLIGMGHDTHTGEVQMIAVEDLTHDELRALLCYAVRELKQRRTAP